MAAYGMPEMLIGLISSTIIGGLHFSPEIMAIIVVVYVAYTADWSKLTNSFAAIANMTNTVCQVYFVKQNKTYTQQISHMQDNIAESEETLDEMQKDPIYISSLESYDSYYKLALGEVMYDMYDMSYEGMYNYDVFSNPNSGVNI